jgi:hypothetical protein
MSHAAATPTVSRDALIADLAGRVGRPGSRLRMLWFVLMAIGAITFAFLLATQPHRAWGAWTINTLYWLGIAQGAIVLACAIRLANGRWASSIMRIAESFSAYLPYGLAFVLVLLVAGIWNYLPWVHEVLPRQKPFLNVPFLYIRTIVGLGLLWWLTRDLVRVSLRTDAHLLKDHVPAELRPAYEKLAQGWRGDAAEVAWQRHRLSQRAPQIIVLYAIVFTLLAWDFIMALTPEWVSTLFGWWFFMGAFLTGIAMTAFVATRIREGMGLEAYITRDHFWDIGKITFGFSIFWVYQFWSQYLVIWYANLPDETGYVFLRFEDPWRTLSFSVFGCVFLVPFLGLMNWTTKKSPFWLAVFCLVILTGMWMERHVLVMPSLNPDVRWVGLPEIGVTLGFLGVFGFAVQGFLRKYPPVKLGDLLSGGGGHGH